MSGWYGSDRFTDHLAALGAEHVVLNPGASIRGFHDSLVNPPGRAPSLVLALHEEVAVAMAHGYAKAAGRPLAVGLHDTVGLLHGSMAIFNAWVDRAPMLLIVGTGPLDAVDRVVGETTGDDRYEPTRQRRQRPQPQRGVAARRAPHRARGRRIGRLHEHFQRLAQQAPMILEGQRACNLRQPPASLWEAARKSTARWAGPFRRGSEVRP